MEEHTKIIEFYGLPGCGKSTLEQFILSSIRAESVTFCHIHDIAERYKELSVLNKIKLYPFKNTLRFFTLLLKVGNPFKKDNRRICRGLLYFLIIYRFCNKKKFSDYVLVDHGIVQSFISLLYGTSSEKFEYKMRLISSFVYSLEIDYLFYCSISAQGAFERIRFRQRKDSGRLDMITDDELLLATLEFQRKQFDLIYEFAFSKVSNISQKINTDSSLNEELSLILRAIQQNDKLMTKM